ncbi:hypothetical protein BBJ28_00025140 [Nothophytophthora sp. Chile5]|nr:hypothetical protein BBJ28_00025140 [Nothophytophthora sp. Chile5]
MSHAPRQPPTSLRSRSKLQLLPHLLVSTRISSWLSRFRLRFAMTQIQPLRIAMQPPVTRLTNQLHRFWRHATPQKHQILPTSAACAVDFRSWQMLQAKKNTPGLADRAVTWMLAPVFFCCVIADSAKPPQRWEATEVFSRVVVSFMLKLFVLASKLTAGDQLRPRPSLEEGK